MVYLAPEHLANPEGAGCRLFRKPNESAFGACRSLQVELQNGTSAEIAEQWNQWNCSEDELLLATSVWEDRSVLTGWHETSIADCGRAENLALVGLVLKLLSLFSMDNMQLDYFSTAALSPGSMLKLDHGCIVYNNFFGEDLSQWVTGMDWIETMMFGPVVFLDMMSVIVLWSVTQAKELIGRMAMIFWECKEGWFPGLIGCETYFGRRILFVMCPLVFVLYVATATYCFKNGSGYCKSGLLASLVCIPPNILSFILFGKTADFEMAAATMLPMIAVVIILLAWCVVSALTCLFMFFLWMLSFFGVLEVIGLLPFLSTIAGGCQGSRINQLNALLQSWAGLETIGGLLWTWFQCCCNKYSRVPQASSPA